MATIQTPPTQSSQRDDPRREESRREEQEKRALENEIFEFDAHTFYSRLQTWSTLSLPKPYKKTQHVTLFQVKEVVWQPLPLSRNDAKVLRSFSATTAKLLSLLRAIDQKGLECPYIHQINRHILESAAEKCIELKQAITQYASTTGFWARLSLFFNKSHIEFCRKDIDFFLKRLEAIIMMCRHQEFAQDLIRLRRQVTYRTGNVLKDDMVSSKMQPSPSSVSAYGRRPAARSPKEPVIPQKSGFNTIQNR